MEPNDKLLCLETIGYESELTVGKLYKLMFSNDTHVLVVNDQKEAAMFPLRMFLEANVVDRCPNCGEEI